jgi:hypothetical protein
MYKLLVHQEHQPASSLTIFHQPHQPSKAKPPQETFHPTSTHFTRMQFSLFALLTLAASTAHAAAVPAIQARDCVDYTGNSWGCGVPAGQSGANYCAVVDPAHPVSDIS